MDFNPEYMEDQVLARCEDAVSDGAVAWAGLIGDEEEANSSPKFPALSVLLRDGDMARSEGVGATRQTGRCRWSVFGSGSNRRERGPRAGRRGPSGAYTAIRAAVLYLDGFIVKQFAEDTGFPLEFMGFSLAGIDQKEGRAVYEMRFEHDVWIVSAEVGE